MIGYERLQKLITLAASEPSQIAESQMLPWCELVTVEIIQGCPMYFLGDEEVTATAAADALDNKPQPKAGVA
jgi:hypothetical protein